MEKVSLVIGRGQKVVFVGESGCDKSTLLKLNYSSFIYVFIIFSDLNELTFLHMHDLILLPLELTHNDFSIVTMTS